MHEILFCILHIQGLEDIISRLLKGRFDLYLHHICQMFYNLYFLSFLLFLEQKVQKVHVDIIFLQDNNVFCRFFLFHKLGHQNLLVVDLEENGFLLLILIFYHLMFRIREHLSLLLQNLLFGYLLVYCYMILL